MKRLSCLFLALISAIGLMVPMAAATDMNENHVNEVYLEAEKLAMEPTFTKMKMGTY